MYRKVRTTLLCVWRPFNLSIGFALSILLIYVMNGINFRMCVWQVNAGFEEHQNPALSITYFLKAGILSPRINI